MQVVFHLGAYSTDADRLIGMLNENAQTLAAEHVRIPPPTSYRAAMRDALVALQGQPADPDTADTLLDLCTENRPEDVRRLLLSHGNFLGLPDRLIGPSGLYPLAADRIGPLSNLFPDEEVEFHLALINPALLLQALASRPSGRSYDELLNGLSPLDLRWEPVVTRMVEAAQGRRLVIWCNEDMPLVLPEVARSFAGLPETTPLRGEEAMLAQLMNEEGLTRYIGYVAQHPPQSISHRRKIVSAFLDKYAKPAALEVEMSLPGWDDTLADEIADLYDDDVARIATMPGVTFIAP